MGYFSTSKEWAGTTLTLGTDEAQLQTAVAPE